MTARWRSESTLAPVQAGRGIPLRVNISSLSLRLPPFSWPSLYHSRSWPLRMGSCFCWAAFYGVRDLQHLHVLRSEPEVGSPISAGLMDGQTTGSELKRATARCANIPPAGNSVRIRERQSPLTQPKSMLQYLRKTWTQNNGNILLSVALVIGLIACVCWYFDVLPKIELRPSNSIVEASPDEPETLFVATIVGPKKSKEVVLTGYVELHQAFSDILPESAAIIRAPFQLGSDNVTAVVLQDIAPGGYTPVVFIDLNKNDLLDFDESGTPTEPIRTIDAPLSPPTTLKAGEQVLDLNEPAYLTFQFNEAIKASETK